MIADAKKFCFLAELFLCQKESITFLFLPENEGWQCTLLPVSP